MYTICILIQLAEPVRCGPAAPLPGAIEKTRRFRKRATSAPADGPAHGLDFARLCESPLRAPQPQKWHDVYGSCTFGAQPDRRHRRRRMELVVSANLRDTF